MYCFKDCLDLAYYFCWFSWVCEHLFISGEKNQTDHVTGKNLAEEKSVKSILINIYHYMENLCIYIDVYIYIHIYKYVYIKDVYM